MSAESHVEEYVALYVLGALPPSERRMVKQHLATCERCRALAVQAESMAHMIPHGVDPVQPSTKLKQNLMARVEADLAAHSPPRSAMVTSTASFANQLSETMVSWARTWSPAVALAAIWLAIVLGWWAWSLQNELSRAREELAFFSSNLSLANLPATAQAPPGSQAKLFTSADRRVALLTVNGLKPLSAAQTYEFWLIRGGQATPAGLFSVDATGSGLLLAQSREAIKNFDQAGISIEPAGGSDSPTLSALVFAGPIK